MKYERLTDRKIAEMLRNTEEESWDSDNIEAQCYIRLAELENNIESGELVDRNEYLDRFMAAKGISRLTDKEIEFFAKHNARVRGNADAKITHLTAEIIKLRARLDKAIELPRIIHPNAYEWFVQYQNEYGLIFDEIVYSERDAEARLKEKKEKNNG